VAFGHPLASGIAAAPTSDEAHRLMQRDGRPSMVNHPSLAHRSYKIPLPKVRSGQELRLK
jgi:hypothetical protein